MKSQGRPFVLGIEELLLTQARQEGGREGEVRGEKRAEARMKERELPFILDLLQEPYFSHEKIASLVDIPVDFVQKVRTKIKSIVSITGATCGRRGG